MSATVAPANRLASIDIVRGAVMVLMAIDHVRVYSGVPAGGPTPGIFFTRWITHFCAPAFVFLSGTSAFLYGRTHDGLSRFLLTRGAWLVLLELTVIRVAWTFNLDFAHYILAGVIWVIGWSMILMAALVRLPVSAVGFTGLIIIFGHNAVGPSIVKVVSEAPDGAMAGLLKILYVGFSAGPITWGAQGGAFWILYSIIPWIGVMAAGYAFGTIMVDEPARRRRLCLVIGLSAIALFLVLRGFNLYGDPRPWSGSLLAFLNTTKYPASLSFLLMTLGPTIAVLPLLETARGPLARWLTVFGRVPFFFYLLHIPLIHVLALLVSKVRQGEFSPWLVANHPMGNPPPPDGYMWSLRTLYAVWAIAVVVLYVACRWYGELKAKRNDWWLGYL
jgi:uncharacterized membrane protein